MPRDLRSPVDRRDQRIGEQDRRIAELERDNTELKREVAELKQLVATLMERLNRNSSNSHLPPSSGRPGPSAIAVSR